MATVEPRTRALAAQQRGAALATLTLAFSSDPTMRWIFPEPDRYTSHFPELIEALAGRAFNCGTAHGSGDVAGVALWLPPGVEPEEQALVALIQRCLPPERQEALFNIVEQLDAHHPAEPFWYLPFIGVDPPRQGDGLGSWLLMQTLEACDQAHQPAYLESSNVRNVSLYERHGFEVLGEVRAGNSPILRPTRRRARPPA